MEAWIVRITIGRDTFDRHFPNAEMLARQCFTRISPRGQISAVELLYRKRGQKLTTIEAK